MADEKFQVGERVVIRATPTLLGVGKIITRPTYSSERLTWAKFKSGTISAFEPGELERLADYIDRHHAEDNWRLPDSDYHIVKDRPLQNNVVIAPEGAS